MVLSQRGELEERDARRLGLSLSTSICKLETKLLQKPVVDQGIKPSSQPSRAARGVPWAPRANPMAGEVVSAPARGQARAPSVSAAWRREGLRLSSTFHHRPISGGTVINC